MLGMGLNLRTAQLEEIAKLPCSLCRKTEASFKTLIVQPCRIFPESERVDRAFLRFTQILLLKRNHYDMI